MLAREHRWQVNVLEARAGRTPPHPRLQEDLDRTLAAWTKLRPVLTTTPWSEPARLANLLTGWREIVTDPADPWYEFARRWAGREEAMAAQVDGGESAVLSHTDLRADNILLDHPSGEVCFLDWSDPGTAAPWADVGLLLGDVVASGASVESGGAIDVADSFARCEPDTDPELATSLISALGAFLHLRAREGGHPAIPHRREWATAASQQMLAFIAAHTR